MIKETIRRGNVMVSIVEIQTGASAGSFRVSGTDNGVYKRIGLYKDLDKARKKGAEKALAMAQRGDFITNLSEEQKEIVKMIVNSDITLKELRSFIESREGINSATCKQVLNEWIDDREDDDITRAHMRDMRYGKKIIIERFGEDHLFIDITTKDLKTMLAEMDVGAKRKKNIRGIFVTIWKWAELNEYGTAKTAVNVPSPKVRRRSGGHKVLMPKELALLMHAAEGEYKTWLAIGAFAGLRTSEMFGNDNPEDRLRWSDFNWAKNSIVIRPETSKTELPRIVPICPALKAWLDLVDDKSGYVFNVPVPYYTGKGESVTARLGELIGGWRDNCLRASRASYRYAETGDLQLTAREDGHSPKTLETNYLNPRFQDDSDDWFKITPDKVKQMIRDENE